LPNRPFRFPESSYEAERRLRQYHTCDSPAALGRVLEARRGRTPSGEYFCGARRLGETACRSDVARIARPAQPAGMRHWARVDARPEDVETHKAKRDKRSGLTLAELAEIERFRPLTDDETSARKRLVDRELLRRWREADPHAWHALIAKKRQGRAHRA
jgi:hypothetical protein